MVNFYEMVAERFQTQPDKVFLRTAAGDLKYQQLAMQTAQIANLLQNKLGLAPGERLLYQGLKCADAISLYLGTLRAGLVYVPINDSYTDAELDYFLRDVEPAVTICTAQRADGIANLIGDSDKNTLLTLESDGSGTLSEALSALPAQPSVPVRANDLAAILYTSGTTGKPKGAMLTHTNLLSNAQALHEIWGWRADDVLLHALPINHVHGLFVALHCALLGPSTIIFHVDFNAQKIIADLPQATVFMGVPTYYTRLLAEPGLNVEVAANMRLFISGSAPLLKETFNAFKRRTGHTILERYGMTETGMIASNRLTGIRQPGTVGQPLPGVKVRLASVDTKQASTTIGALEVHGANVFAGYWRKPEQTKQELSADGWFQTGDLVAMDEGCISIIGRSKDLIISGGLNVYPKEIEGLLNLVTDVIESAVFGVPHSDFGEAVVALCIVRAGVVLDTDKLISQLRLQLAGFKVPKRILTGDALPRNAMGKVQKNLLRDQYSNLFIGD